MTSNCEGDTGSCQGNRKLSTVCSGGHEGAPDYHVNQTGMNADDLIGWYIVRQRRLQLQPITVNHLIAEYKKEGKVQIPSN